MALAEQLEVSEEFSGEGGVGHDPGPVYGGSSLVLGFVAPLECVQIQHTARLHETSHTVEEGHVFLFQKIV